MANLKLQYPVDQIRNAYYAFYFRGFGFICYSFFVIYAMLADYCIYTSLIYIAFILIALSFLIKERHEVKAIKLKSIILNEQGISYYSGMQSNENWQVNWESIKCIKVKLIYVNPVFYVYTRKHDRPYKIAAFHWVNSQTLDDSHIKKLGHKQLIISMTQTQFKELLSYTPLYQYFLTNNIPVQLPDSKRLNFLAPTLKILVIVSFILIFLHIFLEDIFLDHIFVPALTAFFMLILTRCQF